MNEIRIKYNLGLFVVLSHLIIALSLVIIKLLQAIKTDEFTTLIGIIVPMIGGYTTAVTKFIIKDKHRTKFDSKVVTKPYAIFLFLFPSIFFLVLFSAVWMYPFNMGFKDFEDLKIFVLTCETMFGIYVGNFVYSLYQKEQLPNEYKELQEK